MKNYLNLILLFLFIIFFKFSYTQKYSYSFTAGYGVNKALTDIKSSISGSGGMGFYFSPIKNLESGFAFNIGSFEGEDKSYAYKTVTGVRYLTNFYEYCLKAKYNLYFLIDPNPFGKFALYVSTGIGFIEFRDRTEDLNGNLLDGYGYDSEGNVKKNTTTEMFIPLGLGFKYRFDKNYSLSFEPVFNWCNTDKLDYIKGSSKKDHYLFFPLIFEYKLYSKN